ncbi:MAG TPA: hypothetical protein VKH81_05475 [Candidatus Angelobacter sp.]|nr:hypothetical protein [Candidatus Angelobacter sp.]
MSIILAIVFSGAAALWMAIQAPARAVERILATVNSISVGETTEAELLSRKEFQTLDRRCSRETCVYHMAANNALLSQLHLAPYTLMWALVQVRDGMVIGVSVTVSKEGLKNVTMSQVRTLPEECSSIPCVEPLVLPNKFLMSYRLLFDHQSDLRNRIPEAINAQCWSHLHGCSTYAELIPLSRGLNLEQISGAAQPPAMPALK